jgi:UDP-2,3-diacylglucosamine hydrolase
VERPALFVSDLHLSPGRPDMAARFLRFLAAEARGGSALYILGISSIGGDDDADEPFNRGVLDALGALAATGVEVAFQHGNRDFLMSGRAAQRGGLRLIHDPTVRDLFGTRTLLMHGDTLCTDDVRYQRFARIRRPAVVRMFRAAACGERSPAASAR